VAGDWDLPASAAAGADDVSVSTNRLVYPRFDFGSCDRRHKLPFEYPIIFWTPGEAPLLEVRWGVNGQKIALNGQKIALTVIGRSDG